MTQLRRDMLHPDSHSPPEAGKSGKRHVAEGAFERARRAASSAGAVFFSSDCELRPASRELLRRGVAQMLEPRVFDVLVHLVLNRDRVVSTDELLAPHASRTGLARCIMKIRNAIDDENGESLVKTVHRVGYRFVGAVHRVEPSLPGQALMSATPGMPRPTAERIVVALLPIKRSNPDPRCAWFDPIVHALTAKTLATHKRLEVLPLDDVLNAIQNSNSDADLLTLDVQLLQGLRAHCAIVTHVELAGSDFILSWTLYRGDEFLYDRVQGAVLAELAISAAARICDALLGWVHELEADAASL